MYIIGFQFHKEIVSVYHNANDLINDDLFIFLNIYYGVSISQR